MFPVLFHFFGHPVNSYGFFVSLAHLAGISVVLWRARRLGRPLDPYVDLIFTVMLAGLIGARTGYILERRQEFHSVWEWFYLWKGGLSLFSGLLLGFPAYIAMLWWRKMPVWRTSDEFVVVLPFSLAILRIGCFGAGCCHGNKTSLPWGVIPSSPLIPYHLAGEPIHPTQLYESLFLLILCGFLLRLSRKNPPSGVVVTAFLLAYSAFRLLTNPLRGDMEPVIGSLTAAQAGAGVLFLISGAVLIWRGKRRKTEDGSPLPQTDG